MQCFQQTKFTSMNYDRLRDLHHDGGLFFYNFVEPSEKQFKGEKFITKGRRFSAVLTNSHWNRCNWLDLLGDRRERVAHTQFFFPTEPYSTVWPLLIFLCLSSFSSVDFLKLFCFTFPPCCFLVQVIWKLYVYKTQVMTRAILS